MSDEIGGTCTVCGRGTRYGDRHVQCGWSVMAAEKRGYNEAHAELSAERDDYRARYETLKRRVDEQSSSLGYEDEEALAEQLARDANLRAENERLRAALLYLDEWSDASDFPFTRASVRAVARAALEHKHG